MVAFSVIPGVAEKLVYGDRGTAVKRRLKQAVIRLGAAGSEEAYEHVRLAVADRDELRVKPGKNGRISLFALQEILAHVPRLEAGRVNRR